MNALSRPADTLLHIARACGLFAASRALTGGRLRILGYHGIAIDDEWAFQPMLFMRGSTFRARLEQLDRSGQPVLPLTEALNRLRQGTLPPCAVVITIDDGWFGTYRDMAPALQGYGFPATLYLSTYYVEKQTQVFNVATAYALWKAAARTLDIAEVDPSLKGRFELTDPERRSVAAQHLCALADSLDTANERQALLQRLYTTLGVDFDPVRRLRQFAFMSTAEAAELPTRGIDLQLHTHRHRFPCNHREALTDEVEANRSALGRIAPGPFQHLCYPSGVYDRSVFEQLASLRIESATTTAQGTNTGATHPLELRRFLDSEEISPIRFEAELSGFLDLLRRMTGRNRIA
jgi:peptidoglycan/xylan/chitin deacetylase (PgdA/CDA1 family)